MPTTDHVEGLTGVEVVELTERPADAGVRTQAGRPVVTIRPSVGWAALDLQDLWRYRDLLVTLAIRDVKLRYRQTALGVVWVLFQPLLAAGIFAFVFGSVAGLPSDGVPYFLFAYAGLLGWNAFNSTLSKASTSLVQNAPLIAKVYFPRLALPLSTIFSSLIDFAVAAAMLIVMMLAKHIYPQAGVLLLPLWLLLVTLLAVGLGLFSATLMVQYRDVAYVLPVVTQFVMYASPVAYAVSRVPAKYLPLYYLNPLAALLEAFRWSLFAKGSLHGGALLYAAIVSVAVFYVGAMAFKRVERRFADVI